MLGTLMRFLPTLTQIFLWWAIYDVVSGSTGAVSYTHLTLPTTPYV